MKAISPMPVPRATYRLQFNEHFRLVDALALVPYLHELGVSHIYASPLLKAAPHSLHGYDICDFSKLNPELGTTADFENLVNSLREHGMGLVLDIVPNHMGIASPENIWWWDILKNGRASRFAGFFDVDWKSSDPKLNGKVLLPVLGGEYERLLQQGEFQVLKEKGELVLGYQEQRFPLAKSTLAKIPADAAGLKQFSADIAALDRLIRRQHYRLEFHAQADVQLNYRRFFAVNSLAAVREEDEKVFQATHALVRRWLKQRWLDGLRVDHPDGLRDPETYLQRLRALAPKAWIVVEKILEPGELLPASWPVAGTTGYDFLNQVNGLFIDPAGEKCLTDFYAEFTGEPTDYAALVSGKRRAALKILFAAELHRLTGLLFALVARRPGLKNISRDELQEALAEIIVCFPVYRSYIARESGAVSAEDVAAIKAAVHLACEGRKDLPAELFAFLRALLLQPQRGKAAQEFVARFQQLTAPVMAKGVEDTAFYCFNRFASLNEVGSDPSRFGVKLETFHEFLQQQQNHWPHSQLTSSTHDTKRAEDVRARLNLLSEIPDHWTETVRRWSALNARHRQTNFPDRNLEYLYYQTLVGAWPLTNERAQQYLEKAAHEAKQYTTWTKRHAAYEAAVQHFIAETLHDREFTSDLEQFIGTLAAAAAVNSLAQTLIKLTAPGVPDIYQGCELWDFSLVDPDNRRPVHFYLQRRLLAEIKPLAAREIWERRAEGVPKLWLIQKTLTLRAREPDFSGLDYQPLFANGAKSEHALAFARGGKFIVVVPRLVLKLKNDWQDTVLELPPGGWRHEFTGENFSGAICPGSLFGAFPVALLVRKEQN
jgi:(1->4)-alpha-D-glucan 1-alpha-D-glucosylmutase